MRRALLAAIVALAPQALLAQQQSAAAQADSCPVAPDPCLAKPRAGEVDVVLLGDSGFGEGGASEWGSHAQAAVARQIGQLCPRPDLVLLLGDNIYWKGSPDLFGPRFDTMYRTILDPERHRVHSALGNHDVKGCAVGTQSPFPPGGTCRDALRRALAHEKPAEPQEVDDTSWLSPEVAARAAALPRADCLSAFDDAYEQASSTGSECYAGAALRHGPFGYAVYSGASLRYYTVDWAPAGNAQPRLRVLMADSNTLDVVGAALPVGARQGAPPRRDRLQELWMENQLRTAPPGAWTIVAMHHPPFTPTGCAFKFFGKCVGGHSEEQALQDQLRPVFGGTEDGAFAPWRPDLLFTAHNHLYARTSALDAQGHPSRAPGGIRYFVTGGGGAPLYRLEPAHRRVVASGAFYHFVYMRFREDAAFFWTIDDRGRVRDQGCFRKGEGADRCIASGRFDADEPVCGDVAPGDRSCPGP